MNDVTSYAERYLLGLCPDSMSEDVECGPSLHSSLFLKCIEGPWEGGFAHLNLKEGAKVCGSGEDTDVFLRIEADGIQRRHCRFWMSSDSKTVNVSNISKEGFTWVKLRLDGVEYIRVGENVLHLDSLDVSPHVEGIEITKSSDSNEKFISVKDPDLECFICVADSFAIVPGDIIEIGTVELQVHRYKFASASVQGVRPRMEDTHYCTDSMHVGASCLSMFSVYDGHGGIECSRFLRTKFHSIFSSLYLDSPYVRSALSSAFKVSETKFFQMFKERGFSKKVGAVANVVVIDNSALYCANVGDCRALLGLTDGKIVELSRDHKPGLKVEADRIRRLGGYVFGNRVNGRLAVSRALGDYAFKINKHGDNIVSSVPEIVQHGLTGSEEFLVLGSDGLFDVMSSETVGTFVRNRLWEDPKKICVDLISEAVLQRGSTDNVTVIVVLFR